MSHLVWLAVVLAGITGVAVAVVRPAVTAPVPRLGAVAEILTLAAVGLLPPLLLACAAAVLGSWPGAHMGTVGGVCVLAPGPVGPGQLTLYGLAGLLLARMSWLAVRVAVARPAGPGSAA